MADTEERIRTASQFILQAPPGEINDVLNGEPPVPALRVLVHLMDDVELSRRAEHHRERRVAAVGNLTSPERIQLGAIHHCRYSWQRAPGGNRCTLS
jgi:hypothetical protein